VTLITAEEGWALFEAGGAGGAEDNIGMAGRSTEPRLILTSIALAFPRVGLSVIAAMGSSSPSRARLTARQRRPKDLLISEHQPLVLQTAL